MLGHDEKCMNECEEIMNEPLCVVILKLMTVSKLIKRLPFILGWFLWSIQTIEVTAAKIIFVLKEYIDDTEYNREKWLIGVMFMTCG